MLTSIEEIDKKGEKKYKRKEKESSRKKRGWENIEGKKGVGKVKRKKKIEGN